MKQRLVITAYWTVTVLISAIVLYYTLLDFDDFGFADALLAGIMLLPAGLIIKFSLPQILERPRIRKITDFCLLAVTVYLLGLLLLVIGCAIVSRNLLENDGGVIHRAVFVPDSPIIPLTIVFAAILFSAGDWLLTNFLRKKMGNEPVSITFNSERRPVTLLLSEILYVESNDDETWVHSIDGRKYRNITPISQWENLLGIDFVRIHRSFLVARAHIECVKSGCLTIDSGIELPISRKYQHSFSSK